MFSKKRLGRGLHLAVIVWCVGLLLGNLTLLLRAVRQIRVKGSSHNLSRLGGGVLIVSNHVSIWEVMVGPLLRYPRFMWNFHLLAWNVADTANFLEKRRWRWARRRMIGMPRGKGKECRRQALRATHRMSAVVRAGETLLLFPEGGRTSSIKDGERHRFGQSGRRIRPFKPAGLARIMAAMRGRPLTVLPAWVERAEDSRKDLSRRSFDAWQPMTFVFGEPIIFPPGTSGEEMARQLEDAVLALADTLPPLTTSQTRPV